MNWLGNFQDTGVVEASTDFYSQLFWKRLSSGKFNLSVHTDLDNSNKSKLDLSSW